MWEEYKSLIQTTLTEISLLQSIMHSKKDPNKNAPSYIVAEGKQASWKENSFFGPVSKIF